MLWSSSIAMEDVLYNWSEWFNLTFYSPQLLVGGHPTQPLIFGHVNSPFKKRIQHGRIPPPNAISCPPHDYTPWNFWPQQWCFPIGISKLPGGPHFQRHLLLVSGMIHFHDPLTLGLEIKGVSMRGRRELGPVRVSSWLGLCKVGPLSQQAL